MNDGRSLEGRRRSTDGPDAYETTYQRLDEVESKPEE